MAHAMQTAPWLVQESAAGDFHAGGRVSSRALNPEPQPLPAGRYLAWFEGEIYPVPEETGRTPTGHELAQLLEGPPAELAALDGMFSLAGFDPDRMELVLATDRLGLRPLYFTETPDWFAYASEVKALLAIRDKTPPLDAVALRQFFAFDHLLGDRTWWRGIELVPPGSRWRVALRARQECRYWTFDDVPHASRPVADVVQEMGRLWTQAVHQRRKAGLTPLLLSGGLDSRSLLAELVRQGAPVTTLTFGQRQCPDILIARRCARLAGVPHQTLEINPETWWEGRGQCIAATDGLINAMHLHVAVARSTMKLGNEVSPIHIAGDSLFGGSYLADDWLPAQVEGDWRKLTRQIVGRYYQVNPFFARDEVIDASADDIARYLAGPSPECLFYLQRQRRFILHGALGLAPLLPDHIPWPQPPPDRPPSWRHLCRATQAQSALRSLPPCPVSRLLRVDTLAENRPRPR